MDIYFKLLLAVCDRLRIWAMEHNATPEEAERIVRTTRITWTAMVPAMWQRRFLEPEWKQWYLPKKKRRKRLRKSIITMLNGGLDFFGIDIETVWEEIRD